MDEAVEKHTRRALKNLRIAGELYGFVYATKKFHIRKKNPHLSEKELHQEVLNLFEKASQR